jgi:hypothetical protein
MDDYFQEYSKKDVGVSLHESQPTHGIVPILVKAEKDGPISKLSHRSPKTVKFGQ